jgi:hypothetical protein
MTDKSFPTSLFTRVNPDTAHHQYCMHVPIAARHWFCHSTSQWKRPHLGTLNLGERGFNVGFSPKFFFFVGKEWGGGAEVRYTKTTQKVQWRLRFLLSVTAEQQRRCEQAAMGITSLDSQLVQLSGTQNIAQTTLQPLSCSQAASQKAQFKFLHN